VAANSAPSDSLAGFKGLLSGGGKGSLRKGGNGKEEEPVVKV